MKTHLNHHSGLPGKIIVRFGLAALLLAAFFFVPAGSLNYWQAWLYLGTLFIPLCFVLIYLYRHSPDLLERRMHFKEPEKEQQTINKYSFFIFLVAYVLPGFDFRFGWSHVPLWLVITSDILVLAGYLFVVNVFRINAYASRVVEVEQEQTVISNGPYALVRHPMYLGVAVMYTASPLALGSFWALIPGILIIPVLIFRLLSEEKTLERDLKGYKDYQAKVRYHLFPGIW